MSQFHCAVIIPTKNAMPRFVRVLEMVRRQDTRWPFEIIVIDSGSRDGTVEHVKTLPDVRLIQIEPEDFGHGKTRNQAIAASSAKFVALLTHDAEPRDTSWLNNLVAAVEQDDRIAGAFGRHVAYPDASPFVKRDIDLHFEGFLTHPLIVHRDSDPEKFKHDIGWQQFLHFYSDNNSCMRKSIWEKIPYPDVEFAEDQIWAKQIIEAGYAKAYAPDAVAIHSHDYGIYEQMQRAFDEAKNFERYFGYRLTGNMLTALKSAASCIKNEGESFGSLQAYGRVGRRQKAIHKFKRGALVAGHFLGSNHRNLPESISRKLSLDKKLSGN